MNEDAICAINMKGCILSKLCAAMMDYGGTYISCSEKEENTKEKSANRRTEPVTFCL